MARVTWNLIGSGGLLLLGACSEITSRQMATPGMMARQMVEERLSVVAVTKQADISKWKGRKFTSRGGPRDGDGGSAAPISPDGYFLTAAHVISRLEGRNLFVVYGVRSGVRATAGRLVWQSASEDLALLKIPRATPYFYRWTSPTRPLPVGMEVIHGGISTGAQLAPGKLATRIPAEHFWSGGRSFKMDLPLLPGDSGGPIVDATGSLVGVNSAVEFLVPLETAFFVDSEGRRPNIRKIEAIIRKDRARHPHD